MNHQPRLHEMQHLGPVGSMQLAKFIHDSGRDFQRLRDEIQAQEDASLLALSKKPGFEWLAAQIPKRS